MRTRNGVPWTTLEPAFFWVHGDFTCKFFFRPPGKYRSKIWKGGGGTFQSLYDSGGNWRKWLPRVVLFLFHRSEGNRLWMMQSLELGERRRKPMRWWVGNSISYKSSHFKRDVMGTASYERREDLEIVGWIDWKRGF